MPKLLTLKFIGIVLTAGLLSACSISDSDKNAIKPQSSAVPLGSDGAAAAQQRIEMAQTAKTTALPKDTFYLTPKMEIRAGVKLESVTQHSLKKKTTFSSSVEPTSDGSAVVNSLVRGVVSRVLADVGEQVKANQILCYVNCPELSEAQSSYLNAKAKLLEAKAQIASANSRLTQLKADWERQQTLNKEGISSVRQVQSAQASFGSTEAELAAAKAVYAASQSNVGAAASRLRSFGLSTEHLDPEKLTSELAIRSPISGVVSQRTVKPGQNINPAGTSIINAQEGLFHIVNLAKVLVMLEVPQSEVSDLKVGAPVNFRTEVAPGKLFQGHVMTAGENFDPVNRTVSVRVQINNPNNVLKPGMLVLAQAEEGAMTAPGLAVSNSAIQEIDGKPCVFVQVAPNTYKKREIQIGQKNKSYSSILKGLASGERVVTEGSFALKSEALKSDLTPDDG